MIEVCDLSLEINHFRLKNINLVVQEGEFFILLGPTGAGKTIFLEALAGLRAVSSGKILLNGRDITGERPEKRGIAIVYQDFSLFPHLKVRDNIAYGLRFCRQRGLKDARNFNYLVELLNIGHLLDRYPGSLSGGEKQRVALARALIVEPAVLLLDEPFSSLDSNSREALENELKNLHRAIHNEIIMVTHDFTEVRLADRVGVIREGQMEQVGKPEDVFLKPASVFVARFTGMKNLFPVTVSAGKARFPGHEQTVAVEGDVDDGEYFLGIRPENLVLARESIQTANCFQGIIQDIKNKGAYLEITLITSFATWKAITSMSQFFSLGIGEKEKVYFGFAPQHVALIKH